MKDLMIDIEALGNGKNAVIVQIGACYFDRKSGEIGNTFLETIDVEDACKYGDVDGSTLKWWFSQSNEAIKKVMSGDKKLLTVFDLFYSFSKNAECVWSHATYDFVILTNAYKMCGLKPPFGYRTARDIRTLTDLAGIKPPKKKENFKGIEHCALDDAIYQVGYCVEALKILSQEQPNDEKEKK